ncbi:Migration and invasion-inhibitory protein [Merluccius polli]|uniref:Migration and invasion-inhibitory protein n=1 Tax=Merluccius polli TaxID=89951 RepID=A0AA47MTD6_MERPO|nr:Migration and invasion-inhibitory protein [Merluccius polli]
MSSTRRPAATGQQRGRLQPFGDGTGVGRGPGDGTGVGRGPGDGTGTGVGRGPGRRATLSKPAVTFAADLTSGPTMAPQSREGDTRSPPATPVRPGGDAQRRPAEVKVTCHSPEQEDLTSSGSHHRMPPLLGYDWIAGVLDAEGSSLERSEDFFDDLRAFRSMNKDECVSSRPVGLLEEGPSAQQVLTGGDNPESSMGTHQCTFCYRVNSRLFPVPLDPQECCPVCRRHKSTIPHTAAQPALVRVSIPRSTLVPVYEYKAHRRRSFDPSDSLGLPSHCLSGWANTGHTTTPQADNLDLRSSLNVNKTADLLWQTEIDSSLSGGSGCRHGDQPAAVSRLARYNFQHLSPKRKYTRDTSFHVY